MTSDILIGANLLFETGLSVMVTQNHANLVIQHRVMQLRNNSPLFENLNHDLTDKIEIKQLLNLLNSFAYLFTRGYSKNARKHRRIRDTIEKSK